MLQPYEKPSFDFYNDTPIDQHAAIVSLAEYRFLMDSWNILLAEDDPSDVKLTEVSLKASAIPYSLQTVNSGKDVLPHLTISDQADHFTRPNLVILDISLPDKDGFEVLAELAAERHRFRDIPFIIQTGHDHYRYITKAYDLWIPAYITKPCTADKIERALNDILRPQHH